MLKTGMNLLFFSTIDFVYVYSDFAFSANPALKWTCLAGLATSLACFTYTMVRFAVWKDSSTH